LNILKLNILLRDVLKKIFIYICRELSAPVGGFSSTMLLSYYPMRPPNSHIDQKTSTSWETPYKFSGKEKDSETGYSYFGARYYDSDLSVWLSVDPMASKYPSMSAYMYCAGNPVMLVDPDGRKFKTSNDSKIASQLKSLFASFENYFERKMRKHEAKAEKLETTGRERRAARQNKKALEAREGRDEMIKAQEELYSIENSDTEFTFRKNENDGSNCYTYMENDGTVVVEYRDNASASHELVHAYQHLTGEVELAPGTRGAYYVDIRDEINAYKRQYFVNPNSMPIGMFVSSVSDINSSSVRSIGNGKLYGHLSESVRNHPDFPMSLAKKPKRWELPKGI